MTPQQLLHRADMAQMFSTDPDELSEAVNLAEQALIAANDSGDQETAQDALTALRAYRVRLSEANARIEAILIRDAARDYADLTRNLIPRRAACSR